MVAYAIGNFLSAIAPSYGLLLGARFVAGLPHGAYFGVASLVAADLAGPGRRAWAVARVFLGLSVANVVGVPLATALGQALGWRTGYVAAALLAVLTAVGVVRFVPWAPADSGATLGRELGALRRPQVCGLRRDGRDRRRRHVRDLQLHQPDPDPPSWPAGSRGSRCADGVGARHGGGQSRRRAPTVIRASRRRAGAPLVPPASLSGGSPSSRHAELHEDACDMPHTLPRTFISLLLAAGFDPPTSWRRWGTLTLR